MNQLWIDEFAELIAKESYSLILKSPRPKGIPQNAITARVLKFYLETAVLDVLFKYKKDKKLTNNEAYELAYTDFQDLKARLQEDIAEAFDSAFRTFANKPMEYTCMIFPFPDTINREAI